MSKNGRKRLVFQLYRTDLVQARITLKKRKEEKGVEQSMPKQVCLLHFSGINGNPNCSNALVTRAEADLGPLLISNSGY